MGAFHLNQHEKKIEVQKFISVMEELQKKYAETDLCVYTDLNLH